MTALGNMAQATAASVNPATATASGLGKWFAAASAIQAISQVGQGFAQMQAANAESGDLKRQSDIALQEAQYEAQSKQRSVLREAADQTMQYASSGVTTEGSPAIVLEETRRLGQQEVNMIQKRGQMQAQLLRTQAMRAKAAGRQALFGGITNASLGVLNNYIQGRGTFGRLNEPVTNYNAPVGKAIPIGPQWSINPGF